jgi:hypothetical protein
MNNDTKIMLAEAFKVSVRKFVAQNNHSKWGEAESVGVISDMVDAMTSNDYALEEGFDSIRAFCAKVVNPSAFAQSLEKLPDTHPAHIVRPKRGSGGAKGGVEV